MAKHETAIHIWRDTLTERQKESWVSPTSVCTRCPTLKKAIAEANKGKPTRRRRASNKSIEPAIDTIIDHCQELATDERMLLVGRILSSLDLPSNLAKAVKAPAAAPAKTALKWVTTGKHEDFKSGGRLQMRASVKGGEYLIDPAYSFRVGHDTEINYWDVSFYTNYKRREGHQIGTSKVLDFAKALAQFDYDSGFKSKAEFEARAKREKEARAQRKAKALAQADHDAGRDEALKAVPAKPKAKAAPTSKTAKPKAPAKGDPLVWTAERGLLHEGKHYPAYYAPARVGIYRVSASHLAVLGGDADSLKFGGYDVWYGPNDMMNIADAEGLSPDVRYKDQRCLGGSVRTTADAAKAMAQADHDAGNDASR